MPDRPWDATSDVVVVGFGAAGACAAIEAADAGAEVLVLDRFNGGGASAISGGVVYAGGGTAEQQRAGISDDAEQMYSYLRLETAGAVREETLRRFCDESVGMIEWLKGNGVPFHGSAAPYKTSYPTNDYYLYYSGNELAGPSRAVAEPAARGHRAHGKGTSGKALFGPLRDAARRRGVTVAGQTRAIDLVTDAFGRVVGVECLSMRGAPARIRREHRLLAANVGKLNLWYRPVGKRISKRLLEIERRYGRPWRVRADPRCGAQRRRLLVQPARWSASTDPATRAPCRSARSPTTGQASGSASTSAAPPATSTGSPPGGSSPRRRPWPRASCSARTVSVSATSRCTAPRWPSTSSTSTAVAPTCSSTRPCSRRPSSRRRRRRCGSSGCR